MSKNFDNQCHALMRTLLECQDETHLLDLANNKGFFHDLQANAEKWGCTAIP